MGYLVRQATGLVRYASANGHWRNADVMTPWGQLETFVLNSPTAAIFGAHDRVFGQANARSWPSAGGRLPME